MKQVKRRTWFCLVFTALLTLGILLFLARYFTVGGDWASFSANKHIYDKSGQLISGAVLDRTGTVLYDAASGAYSDDKIIRQATLHAVGDRAKYASRMTRMTVDCNAELERVKRTYTEIGRLYYENYRDTADAFLAELCQQVTDANARVAELEAQMDELRAAAKEYRPAPDLHTVDAEVVEPEDIEVEVTEEPAPEE